MFAKEKNRILTSELSCIFCYEPFVLKALNFSYVLELKSSFKSFKPKFKVCSICMYKNRSKDKFVEAAENIVLVSRMEI